MLITILTAILNLYVALRIVSFTQKEGQAEHKNRYFYTAIAVLVVAISFENALSIIFVGQAIFMSEFVFTLLVALIVFAVKGDIGKIFELVQQQSKRKISR